MGMLVPYVIETTDRGERGMDIYSRLLRDRIIFLGTPIDDAVSNTVIAQLLLLTSEDPEADILRVAAWRRDWQSLTRCSTSLIRLRPFASDLLPAWRA